MCRYPSANACFTAWKQVWPCICQVPNPIFGISSPSRFAYPIIIALLYCCFKLFNRCFRVSYKDKGLEGVPLLLVFVAVVTIATTAAVVIMHTGAGLREWGYLFGGQTEDKVSGGLEVVGVAASDASSSDRTPGAVEVFEVSLRTTPGSNSLNLDNLLLILTSDDNQSSFRYGQVLEDINANPPNQTHFTAFYLHKGGYWNEGYVGRGDVVVLKFNNTFSIRGNEVFKIHLAHKDAMLGRIDVITPVSMSKKRIQVHPPRRI
ncbi:MAG: hypothetical protein GF334_12600 [Candidatus Altiarchaeales archaeon]|nr:hypothetical protein [Candidatus Altiarchaeales archaeon]